MKFKTPKLTIFVKLILVVIVFGLLLNLSVIMVIRLSTDTKPRIYMRDFMRKMERSIVYDIGIPPDTVKANQICDDLGIEMRFEAPGRDWTSSEKMPKLGDLLKTPDNMEKFQKDESSIAYLDGNPYSIIRFPQGVFIIKPFNTNFFSPQRAVLFMILFISIIIVLLYFLIRRLLGPLKDLSLAVNKIGEGDYNVKIPVNRKDELGELADSINQMSLKISNSIKSKEQLLIDVSHELRSPLTRVKLGLEVGSPKEKIEEDINEMERMVTGLLENYRADASFANLKVENTDVTDLLMDTISEYEAIHRIRFSRPDHEINLNIDSDKMQIVFRNLIDNALKYSNEIIEIEIRELPGSVLIIFKDKGIGISEKDLKYIFEPFYRADPSRSRKTGGFGLGLSICRKLIEAHNGEIIINSTVNAGTEVILKMKKG